MNWRRWDAIVGGLGFASMAVLALAFVTRADWLLCLAIALAVTSLLAVIVVSIVYLRR